MNFEKSAINYLPTYKDLTRLPRRFAAMLVWVYQCTLSPLKVYVLGMSGCCRFHPTCSEYARQALMRHGVLRGTALSVWRLCKCHPFHPGGEDPVPQAHGRTSKHADEGCLCSEHKPLTLQD